MNSEITIREAVPSDLDFIHKCIHALADFEKLGNNCIATKEIIQESLFTGKNIVAKPIIVSFNSIDVGLAIYFFNYSTFTGRNGVYLEDVYVDPEYRSKGIGNKIFKYLAGVCVANNCSRFEFSCLDWNQGAIDFYVKSGAVRMEGWSVYRIQDEALIKLAQ